MVDLQGRHCAHRLAAPRDQVCLGPCRASEWHETEAGRGRGDPDEASAGEAREHGCFLMGVTVLRDRGGMALMLIR